MYIYLYPSFFLFSLTCVFGDECWFLHEQAVAHWLVGFHSLERKNDNNDEWSDSILSVMTAGDYEARGPAGLGTLPAGIATVGVFVRHPDEENMDGDPVTMLNEGIMEAIAEVMTANTATSTSFLLCFISDSGIRWLCPN